MPWKECHIMDEPLRFVARLLEGEKLRQQLPMLPHMPAISTVHAVLDRHGFGASAPTAPPHCHRH
jgi:hypothetical protein